MRDIEKALENQFSAFLSLTEFCGFYHHLAHTYISHVLAFKLFGGMDFCGVLFRIPYGISSETHKISVCLKFCLQHIMACLK